MPPPSRVVRRCFGVNSSAGIAVAQVSVDIPPLPRDMYPKYGLSRQSVPVADFGLA